MKEALKLALEALEQRVEDHGPAIAAVRKALAQPEHEPFFTEANGFPQTFVPKDRQKQAIISLTDQCAALIQERDELQKQVWRHVRERLAQPEQEPVAWVNQANLNSAVIQRNRGGQGDTHTWSETPNWYHPVPLYTAPQPAQQQKPVACQPRGLIDIGRVFTPEKEVEELKPIAWKKKGAFHFCNQPPVDVEKWIPLYKSHTQRWQTWASLTDEEIETIHQSAWIQSTATLNDFARAVEAKLKEKNT